MIMLDTSILSQVLRRNRQPGREIEVQAIRELIASDRPVALPGIVVQEMLSGIRSSVEERAVSTALDGFPIHLADLRAHREAALVFTRCASEGIAVTHIDCLIAAQAMLAGAELFTLDSDFVAIARLTGLVLFEASAANEGFEAPR